MTKQWLNQYVAIQGEWVPGQSGFLQNDANVNFGARGADIRIYETARSGSVVLAPQGATLTSSGDAEVFLTITYSDGRSENQSAPTITPMDLSGVSNLRVSTLVIVGNGACTGVHYVALVNAHCIYERTDLFVIGGIGGVIGSVLRSLGALIKRIARS